MPIYEYQCEACGKVFEVLQKVSDPAPEACEECGEGVVKKVMSQTSFVLKGEGWYVTDYGGKKGKSEGSPDSGASSPKSDSNSDSKSESKVSKGD